MCVTSDELPAEVMCRPHIEVATARDHPAVWTSFLTRNRKTYLSTVNFEIVDRKMNTVPDGREVLLWESSNPMTDALFSFVAQSTNAAV